MQKHVLELVPPLVGQFQDEGLYVDHNYVAPFMSAFILK